MPITVEEKFDSGELTSGDGAQVTLTYLIRGTSNLFEASVALGQAAPATYADLVLKNCRVEYHTIDTWTGVVTYCLPEAKDKEVGTVRITGDTTGGTQHITQSLATIGNHAPAGQTAPDFKGAIGVTADSVEGVDIVVPVFNFTVTKVWETPPSLAAIYALTGKVNSGPFSVTDTQTGLTISVAAGECLFNGASFGGQQSDGGVAFTYSFAASPNKTNLTVGDITVPAKKGWEYLWVRYEDKEDAGAKMLVKRPLSAHVEKVYQEGDFSQLGLGA